MIGDILVELLVELDMKEMRILKTDPCIRRSSSGMVTRALRMVAVFGSGVFAYMSGDGWDIGCRKQGVISRTVAAAPWQLHIDNSRARALVLQL